jgi:UDP-N-acetylglucosamine--N-acetylmuramyl-(pentapeptide) pyrophosphoryl-undecaprenol N-acetylglucosamine transferase
LYAAADVFVGRGGASTVHEVAATGTPAVLVPWSGASEEHQVANVRWLSDSGGAVLVPDNDVDAVVAALSALLDDEQRRSAVGSRAREIGGVHHGGEISRQILDAIR